MAELTYSEPRVQTYGYCPTCSSNLELIEEKTFSRYQPIDAEKVARLVQAVRLFEKYITKMGAPDERESAFYAMLKAADVVENSVGNTVETSKEG